MAKAVTLKELVRCGHPLLGSRAVCGFFVGHYLTMFKERQSKVSCCMCSFLEPLALLTPFPPSCLQLTVRLCSWPSFPGLNYPFESTILLCSAPPSQQDARILPGLLVTASLPSATLSLSTSFCRRVGEPPREIYAKSVSNEALHTLTRCPGSM
jgi:hypothetical protein